MNKWILVVCVSLCLLQPALAQSSKDQVYQVTQAYQANDQGQVLNQQPFNGQVILSPKGTYKASLHIQDKGTWKLVKAGPQQPRATIVFTSKNNFQFYGYPQGNTMSLWLNRSAQGISQWLSAQLSGSKPAPGGSALSGGVQAVPQGAGNLVRGGVFTAVVLYGTTSAPTYYWYDRDTGGFSSDEKGLIFRPDGTYYLRADFGSTTMEERGRYAVQGDTIRIVFSDGSGMNFKIVEGGRKLHNYDPGTGMLMSEYFFLGTAK
ncbi:MAG: hypothetical protein A2Y56_13630 [Candidatus Aminicenantes bacterium RBG_13_63_10]|nr:MAG: hypothetical protein A2Y56_13630 [Candidatus Aminicenantes bacterium RBG_13_63_10]